MRKELEARMRSTESEIKRYQAKLEQLQVQQKKQEEHQAIIREFVRGKLGEMVQSKAGFTRFYLNVSPAETSTNGVSSSALFSPPEQVTATMIIVIDSEALKSQAKVKHALQFLMYSIFGFDTRGEGTLAHSYLSGDSTRPFKAANPDMAAAVLGYQEDPEAMLYKTMPMSRAELKETLIKLRRVINYTFDLAENGTALLLAAREAVAYLDKIHEGFPQGSGGYGGTCYDFIHRPAVEELAKSESQQEIFFIYSELKRFCNDFFPDDQSVPAENVSRAP